MASEEQEEEGMGCDVCMMNCAKPENLIGAGKYDYKCAAPGMHRARRLRQRMTLCTALAV
jgi:hypothetical protein